jgi:hypothetical protein
LQYKGIWTSIHENNWRISNVENYIKQQKEDMQLEQHPNYCNLSFEQGNFCHLDVIVAEAFAAKVRAREMQTSAAVIRSAFNHALTICILMTQKLEMKLISRCCQMHASGLHHKQERYQL